MKIFARRDDFSCLRLQFIDLEVTGLVQKLNAESLRRSRTAPQPLLYSYSCTTLRCYSLVSTNAHSEICGRIHVGAHRAGPPVETANCFPRRLRLARH